MKNKNGFTLTELLVVVAIIGILASIAIPGYLGTQTRAKREAATSEIKTLASALELYYQEHNNYGPGGSDIEVIKDNYRAFKSNNTQFDFKVEITDGGQGYLATCSYDFGKYSSVTIDQNSDVTWIE